MKLFLYYKKNIILLLIFLLFFISDSATASNIEKDFKELTLKLRCMTCQNQNIYESDTDFSRSIKKIILEKLEEGHSQKEISDFLVKRYGEYILLQPLFNKKNIFLWVFPFTVLFFSLIYLFIRTKKNKIFR